MGTTNTAAEKTGSAADFLDLDALDPKALCNAGAWLEIRLDNEPIGLEIKIQGRFSDTFEKIQQKSQREAIAEFKKTGKFPVADPVDQKEKKILTAVQCSTDWRGPATKGQPFSAERIEQQYRRHGWMLEQVDAGITEDSRFLKQ